MGSYTELCLDVVLGGVPTDVIEELQRMVVGEGRGAERRATMLTFSSTSHDYEPPVLTAIGSEWRLSCGCSLKNYDGDIEWFLDWIAPYVLTTSQAGHTQHEQDDAEPIWFWGGTFECRTPPSGITAEEALANAANSPLEKPWPI